MNDVRSTVCWIVLLVASPLSGEGLESVELSVFGAYLSNAHGPGSEADIQETTLRLSTGDLWQLFVDLPGLRVRSASALPGSGLGPIPMDPRRHGPGEPPGSSQSGEGGPSGQGPGGGGSVPDTTLPASDSLPDPTDDWTTGAGDLRIGVGHRLAGGGAKLFRADAELEVKVPTADETENLGTGELDLRLGVSGEYRFWSANAFAGLGFNRLGDPEWADLNDVVDAFAGLESEPIGERVILSGWLQANEAVVDGAGSPVMAGLDVRSLGRVRWTVQLTTRVSGPVADLGAGFGVSYGLDREVAGRRSRR
jgi:hypothetical protein